MDFLRCFERLEIWPEENPPMWHGEGGGQSARFGGLPGEGRASTIAGVPHQSLLCGRGAWCVMCPMRRVPYLGLRKPVPVVARARLPATDREERRQQAQHGSHHEGVEPMTSQHDSPFHRDGNPT